MTEHDRADPTKNVTFTRRYGKTVTGGTTQPHAVMSVRVQPAARPVGGSRGRQWARRNGGDEEVGAEWRAP